MSGLILPPSHTIHGREPKWACTLCGHPFYEGERVAYERHVVRGHSHEEIRSHSDRVRFPAFYDNYHPDFNDVGWQRWIDKNNAERPEQWRRWMKTGLDK
jgi:hypothetical protein